MRRIFFGVMLALIGCRDKGIEPLVARTPREYVWTSAELLYPGDIQSLMSDIWGNSAKDVYIVGHSGDIRGSMWHFDGKDWVPVSLSTVDGGPISGSFSLQAIDGLSRSNVWIVGRKILGNSYPFFHAGFVAHFDGQSWVESEEIARDSLGYLEAVYVASSGIVWTGGDGEMWYCESATWRKDSIALDSRVSIQSIAELSSEGVYATGLHWQIWGGSEDSYYFLKREPGGLWNPIDSCKLNQISTRTFGPRLWLSPTGKLYSASINGLYRWDGSSWENIFSFSSGVDPIMFGSNDDNIFVLTSEGLFHHDGNNWFLNAAPELNNNLVAYRDGWTNGLEAFIIGNTLTAGPTKTVILHGK